MIISEPFSDVEFVNEDIYPYFEIKNVHTIELHFNKYTLDLEYLPNMGHTYTYLNIDTMFHDVFSHWVFESAIYLPLFLKLKKKYPDLKLYSKGYKMYKKLFYDYFDICETDIVYQLESSNRCLFPKPISSLNVNRIDEAWKTQVDYFFNELNVGHF